MINQLNIQYARGTLNENDLIQLNNALGEEISTSPGWRLGLVGRNGRGKTTLLRLLQRQYEYDGAISVPGTGSAITKKCAK